MAKAASKRTRDEDEHPLVEGSSSSPAKRVRTTDSLEPIQASSSENQQSTEDVPVATSSSDKSSESQILPPPPTSVDLNKIRKYEQLWFDDGDMIIWIENYPDKNDAALARVHRQKLATSALEPLCAAIDYEIPPEGTPGELFLDGVWVNKYEQQSPDEVLLMLVWIYFQPSTRNKIQLNFFSVKTLLKRSEIHNNSEMRRCALDYLWNMFPSSLNYHHRVPCLISDCYAGGPDILYNPVTLCELTHISDQYNLVCLLPLLYYYIAQWPIEWITDGLPTISPPGASSEAPVQRKKLPVAHAFTVLKGRSLLIGARRGTVFNFLDQFSSSGVKLDHPTDGCPQTVMASGETCFEWLRRVHLYLIKRKYMDKPNALEIMNVVQWDTFRKHLCPACAKRVLKHMLEGRDEVWDSLPNFFGLQSWEKIAEDQRKIEAELFEEIR